MSTWQSGFITANGMSLYYTRTGGDGPPLVLAHGMADSGLCWSRLARALEDEYDIIMPDARSHGRSERSPGDYPSEVLADDLAGVIEGLNLDQPIVIGHSMGATTALFLAAAYPRCLRAAVLEDPPIWSTPRALTPVERAAQQAIRRAGLERDKSQGRETLLIRAKADNPSWAPEEWDDWLDSKMMVDTGALPYPSTQSSWREVLARISCPTLLLTGDPALGAIVTAEVARECTDIQPLVTVAHIAGAGHSIRREQFDAYVGAVRSFLAQHARDERVTR